MSEYHVIAIILAAGESRRLGRPKQLVRLPTGTTLIRHTIECFRAARIPVVVITGAHRERVANAIQGRVARIVYNAGWKKGMASSIRSGVVEADQMDASHVILSVVDQPHLSSDVIQALLETSKQHTSHIVTCEFANGVHGPPTIFPRDCFAQLLELEGDRGARSIVDNSTNVRTVPFDGGEVDIDAASDLP